MNSFLHWPSLLVHYPYRYTLLFDKEITMDAITAMSATDLFGAVILVLFLLPVIGMFALGFLELFRNS